MKFDIWRMKRALQKKRKKKKNEAREVYLRGHLVGIHRQGKPNQEDGMEVGDGNPQRRKSLLVVAQHDL